MITGKFIRGDQDLSEAKEIRMSVFVDEQGFPAESEMDEYDARAIHCLLYNDDHKPSATARLFIDDDGRAYMYFDRFNDGLNIWVVELEDDCTTLKKETMRPCIHVSQEWEKVTY